MKLLYRTSDGVLVSVGTVIADPLPAGLSVHDASPVEDAGLRTGAKQWDPATRTVIDTPGWVDPTLSETNRVTLEDQIRQAMASLQQIIDAPQVTLSTPTFSNIAQAQTAMRTLATETQADLRRLGLAVQTEARNLRRLIRLVANDLSDTT